MRIAVTNPTNWPAVRRGVERFINDFGEWFAARGHQVTLVSAHAGPKLRTHRSGFYVVLHRRLWRPWMQRFGILEFHLFFFTAAAALIRMQTDAVVCCTFMDALAAIFARRFTGAKCVFWVNGLPPRISYSRALSAKGRLFRYAVAHADEVVAISEYMRRNLLERFERPGVVVPPGVNLRHFRLNPWRDPARTVILCPAALDDRRKGGRSLMKAFNIVKAVRPEATLRISCQMEESLKDSLLALVEERWRGDVEFLGAGEITDLPALFGDAAVTVLASRWEPFGMVVVESLATGTPVAAVKDGALPEILDDPRVGRLADPGPETEPEPVNVAGLADAILECIELSRDPETPGRCRKHAERYSWDAVGSRLEQLLLDMASANQQHKREPVRI